ncbi:MAG: DUF5668 domain-containing protein [bacterium]|nr:DUF5668 domain-containing protein [bacterium]
MKIAGIVLVWVGALLLLQNLRVIPAVTLAVYWPVIVIIIGISLKHFKHGVKCGMGGKCGVCQPGNKHVCEGPDCTH